MDYLLKAGRYCCVENLRGVRVRKTKRWRKRFNHPCIKFGDSSMGSDLINWITVNIQSDFHHRSRTAFVTPPCERAILSRNDSHTKVDLH